MSRQFLLDGYNLLQQMPALARQTLEAGRRGLVLFIAERAPQGSVRNPVTVVFDGRAEFSGSENAAGVRVLFSRGESADELIKRLVEESPRPGDLVLVTDDRDLGYYCRTHGVRWWHVRDFLAKAAPASVPAVKGAARAVCPRASSGRPAASGASRRPGVPAEGKDIPCSLAARVNRELSQRWLGNAPD